ncbi:hypothetical protein R1flu_004185 [Riccia fluitans]|uniref:TOD1/MUCI70 glycosyltransferase-like domain-containing protein n=1 Tax=Riccia fluitans TaxID=41844 RepID=A0ABD1YQ34_9MARC
MRRQNKNWMALRTFASKDAGMWAALMLGLLSLLMIVNNFHIISFHFRQLPFPQDTDSLFTNPWGVDQDTDNQQSEGQNVDFVNPQQDESQPFDDVDEFRPPLLEDKHDDGKGILKFTPPVVEPRRNNNEKLPEDKNRTRAAPVLFTDPSLPPDHPCQGFTLPPPPSDPKKVGPRPCPVCYLPVEQAIKTMPPPGSSPTPVLKHLSYIREPEIADVLSSGSGSEFGGHPTLEDRAQSYAIQENMAVHCGFVKGSDPGVGTGYDISEEDRAEMHKCGGVVVASAVFGNYDLIQQPANISEQAKATVCFVMFIDEETEQAVLNNADLRSSRKIGLWRMVVVKNLPYSDPRRTGKIPKLLMHRLFPNARFSLWVDGKLQLVVDPYKILERFLWRSNDTIAISKHYKRFDVFQEAEANKAAGKYDNATIDAQVEFYRNEGMTPYSRAKLPLVSDVPEGCVIIREHTPLSNLFGCLWFNEVDRFTSRDQISFGIVRDKIMAQVPSWWINMFLDCERRNFVVQGYHKDVLEQKMAQAGVHNGTTTVHRRSRRLRNRS